MCPKVRPKRGHIREQEEFRQRRERDRTKYHRPPPGGELDDIERADMRWSGYDYVRNDRR